MKTAAQNVGFTRWRRQHKQPTTNHNCMRTTVLIFCFRSFVRLLGRSVGRSAIRSVCKPNNKRMTTFDFRSRLKLRDKRIRIPAKCAHLLFFSVSCDQSHLHTNTNTMNVLHFHTKIIASIKFKCTI